MSKIIFNPEAGVEIKHIDGRSERGLIPGEVIKVDDRLGHYMLETWGFLVELSQDEAKKYLEGKDELQCPDCEFKTKMKPTYDNHKKKHLKNNEEDILGIPVITLKKPEVVDVQTAQLKRQAAWNEEERKEGLIGEGDMQDNV